MVKITTFGKLDALSTCGELRAPMVVLCEKDDDGKKAYIGFVPGILMDNVVSSSKEDCKAKLKEQTMNVLGLKKKKKSEFPFFPNKEEIMQDFENVADVSFIKISSHKKEQKK